MIPINRKKAGLFILIILILAAVAFTGYSLVHRNTPVRIGVLLPLTGDIELKEPLEWAKENINAGGGINGRPVELVYRDTGQGDTKRLAEELLTDDSVRIVIGPPTSDDVFTLAPEFIKKEKILISPLATSGDIIRAFGKTGYFWRTAQGDVAQVKTMLSLLKERNVRRIALLSENTTYGRTFYDWTGFFSLEYGLELVSIRKFEPGSPALDAEVDAALLQEPEYIIAACGPQDAATIQNAILRSKKPVKLFLADAAATPVLTSTLGTVAEGIEGTSPTADPESGFSKAYWIKFGHAPTDYAAPAYDALLLAAYTAARQDSTFFESPADSIRHVVYGNGTPVGWDARGVSEALLLIRGGGTPAVSGASGALDYDAEFGVDPLVTYYSHWIISNGQFRTLDIRGSAKPGAGIKSAARTQASENLMGGEESSTELYRPPQERTDFLAVIVGPSKGWPNYRHQSDALAVYTLLRGNGVPDDHIVLMLYDDVATSPQNPVPGDIHNVPQGRNLRSGAEADYTGRQVTAQNLKKILLGNQSEDTPVVLNGSRSTDVFVYIASHGSPGIIVFSGTGELFTAEDFREVAAAMARGGKYRQIVYMVDTCFGESIAQNVTERDLLYFTGAASTEPSRGAVYDLDIRQWLSDEFTASTLYAIRSDPDITFLELYTTTYEKVTGSHVRMLNAENFGPLDIPVREYLSP